MRGMDTESMLATLEAALELAGVPAFVVHGDCRVAAANRLARNEAADDPEGVRSSIELALRGGPSPFEMFTIAPDTFLLKRLPPSDAAPPGLHRLTQCYRLTPMERRVVELLAFAASNAAIAERLEISARTVEGHVGSILEKTSCPNRVALISRIWLG